MNMFDIICLIVLSYAGWKGFKKGFIIEIFGILALFAGIYGGIHFSDAVANWLRKSVDIKEEWLPAASFTLTFIGVLVGIHFLAKAVTKLLNIAQLSIVNKLAGALFGLLKAAMILSIVLMLIHPLNGQMNFLSEDVKKESLFYQPIHDFSSTLIPAIRDSKFYHYLQKEGWIPKELPFDLDELI